jgi:ribose transport system permease protein
MILRGEIGLGLILAAVIGFFAVADALQPRTAHFASVDNLRVVLVQASTVAVAAMGMTIVIISGGIDLSAGSVLALSATVLAWCLKSGTSPALAVAASVVTGTIAGLINGLVIGLARIMPFIVTLGTMTVSLGLAKLIARETTVRPPLEAIPDWLGRLTSTRAEALWLGMPRGIWVALALAGLLHVGLTWTVFGRHVAAVGSNESAAWLCGIRVSRLKAAVYALAGAFFGAAGVYQFARLAVGNPTSGVGMELRMIAAVVLGGGSLAGGQGSVFGTLIGAALMAVIASGCSALRLSNPLQDIVIGLIVVLAVAIDRVRRTRDER